MDISNSVALVTGGNRGLGRHFAGQLLERGAKVYVGVRNPDAVDLPGAIPVRLDITDHRLRGRRGGDRHRHHTADQQRRHSTGGGLVEGDIADIRREMATHFFGSLDVIRAFAPVLRPTAAAPCSTCCRCCRGRTFPASARTASPRPPSGR